MACLRATSSLLSASSLGRRLGLSAAVITRLTETWRAEQRAFAARDLSGVDYVYLWADGIHVNIRLEEHKLCLLVMIGVRADGRKELIALAEIWGAEDKPHALAAVKAFKAAYGAKFPKATVKITEDLEELLAFYDYPAEHWVHLRTTNPIESTFATVRHRTKVTKGPGSRAGDSVQSHRGSPGLLARRQRPAPGRPGPRRSDLHRRQAC
jgi:transposase-like protein